MTRRQQKQREERFVRAFLRATGADEVLESLQRSERPDFIARIGGKSVGIEVHQMFRSEARTGVTRRAQEGGWQHVASLAQHLWRESGRPPLHVWLFFNSQYHVPKKKSEEVARRIVSLVARHMPKKGEGIQVRVADLAFGSYPEELVDFSARWFADVEEHRWLVNDAGFEGVLEGAAVQQALDEKNDKLRGYSPHQETYWLLLVLHGGRVSSSMRVADEAKSRIYRSSFNRVCIYETAGARVTELMVQNSDSRVIDDGNGGS